MLTETLLPFWIANTILCRNLKWVKISWCFCLFKIWFRKLLLGILKNSFWRRERRGWKTCSDIKTSPTGAAGRIVGDLARTNGADFGATTVFEGQKWARSEGNFSCCVRMATFCINLVQCRVQLCFPINHYMILNHSPFYFIFGKKRAPSEGFHCGWRCGTQEVLI